MSNITAVIFDFNGTLYFDSHLHIEAWKRFLKLHNFPAMTDEQFKEKFLGRNNAEIMEMLHGRPLPPDELETLAEEKEIVFIVSSVNKKKDIMKAIMQNAGVESKAHALVFSLPVSETAGFRFADTVDKAAE